MEDVRQNSCLAFTSIGLSISFTTVVRGQGTNIIVTYTTSSLVRHGSLLVTYIYVHFRSLLARYVDFYICATDNVGVRICSHCGIIFS